MDRGGVPLSEGSRRDPGAWGCGQRCCSQSLRPSLLDEGGDTSFPPKRKSSSLHPKRNRGYWERRCRRRLLSSPQHGGKAVPPQWPAKGLGPPAAACGNWQCLPFEEGVSTPGQHPRHPGNLTSAPGHVGGPQGGAILTLHSRAERGGLPCPLHHSRKTVLSTRGFV